MNLAINSGLLFHYLRNDLGHLSEPKVRLNSEHFLLNLESDLHGTVAGHKSWQICSKSTLKFVITCIFDYYSVHRGLGEGVRDFRPEIIFFRKWFGGLPWVPLEGIPPWNPQESLSGGPCSVWKSAWR